MSQKASKRNNISSPVSPLAANTISNDENASLNIDNTKIDLSFNNQNNNDISRLANTLKPLFDTFREEMFVEFDRKHY